MKKSGRPNAAVFAQLVKGGRPNTVGFTQLIKGGRPNDRMLKHMG